MTGVVPSISLISNAPGLGLDGSTPPLEVESIIESWTNIAYRFPCIDLSGNELDARLSVRWPPLPGGWHLPREAPCHFEAP